jgi:hypothetical protein
VKQAWEILSEQKHFGQMIAKQETFCDMMWEGNIGNNLRKSSCKVVKQTEGNQKRTHRPTFRKTIIDALHPIQQASFMQLSGHQSFKSHHLGNKCDAGTKDTYCSNCNQDRINTLALSKLP